LLNNEIKDYQITAFLMTIYFNKLDFDETFYLTKAIINSGKIFSWPSSVENLIDKHSTGGIGDKVSLIILPLLSCLDVNVAKISGRGLGYTGGTIDKLDSINMKTDLTNLEATEILLKNHFFIMQQTKDIVPADKILYELRDTSGTINNISLIVASIMSKKIALNTNHIYLDVKVGDGAFFSNLNDAIEFGELCIAVGKKFNKNVLVHYTDMNKPLGRCLGNLIEVKEAVDFLQGKFECLYLKELIFEFSKDILLDLNICKTPDEAITKIENAINSKKAITAFLNWNKFQQGNLKTIQNLNNFYNPKFKKEIKSWKDGYVNFTSNKQLGLILIDLKAGRKVKNDKLDFLSGLYLNKYSGEFVKKNETIITVYASSEIDEQILNKIKENIEISDKKIDLNKTILKVSK
ncbi:MAG: thymidine phosphorylase, partial [Malacoplasma sp.]|nr:thymidine phosphorylase [Malacoplasma sp.]